MGFLKGLQELFRLTSISTDFAKGRYELLLLSDKQLVKLHISFGRFKML